ncbi:hypothetical protein KSS87_020414 [Heliosperma pusillum]|nr:hypothetical protein KSS87_020414 [Heliosperma pusillum]
MLGKKRRNDSFTSNSDANPFQLKRVTPESPISGTVPAAAELKVTAVPLLDRRKAALQHVRALNTEFASWVQSQLQDHCDELWEDGVRDYLTHASEISEKFTDVVSWLKTNNGREGSLSTLEPQNTEKKNGPETITKEYSVPVKSLFGLPANNVSLTSLSSPGVSSTPALVDGTTAGSAPSWSFGLSANSQSLSQSSSAGLSTSWNPGAFANNKSVSPAKAADSSSSPGSGIAPSNLTTSPLSASGSGLFSTSSTPASFFSTSLAPSFSTTSSFTTPWSAGAFGNSQTTFQFGGTQTSAPANIATTGADEDDEPEQPSSPSLQKSEEEGVVVVHETKCKLFIKSSDPADKEPWKDKGIGQLFIKCDEGASKGTKESKPRILVRNDVGRIMLNVSIYSGIKTNLQKNAIVAIFHTLDESAGDGSKTVARTFLIRVKNEDERNKLADVIREYAPTA